MVADLRLCPKLLVRTVLTPVPTGGTVSLSTKQAEAAC
jgi:hypothetical protein